MQSRDFDGSWPATAAQMKRYIRRCSLLAACWLGLLGSVQAADVPPEALKDERGRSVVLSQPPQRIVSLLPSLTETVCALGACDKLVGVDRYSNWPEDLQRKLPVVGGGLDPNVEAIVALKPDVVLLSSSARVGERLEALGLRTVALEPRTSADVLRVMHSVGVVLGQPPQQVQAVWQRMQNGVQAAAQSLPPEVQGARVYFEVTRGPYVAGPSSFIGKMLSRMQLGNVVPQEMGPFPRVNPEFIVRARPDVILMVNHSMQAASSYPGWQSLEAVKQQRICTFDARESDVIVRPGPRMDEAAALIARCVREKAPRRGHE